MVFDPDKPGDHDGSPEGCITKIDYSKLPKQCQDCPLVHGGTESPIKLLQALLMTADRMANGMAGMVSALNNGRLMTPEDALTVAKAAFFLSTGMEPDQALVNLAQRHADQKAADPAPAPRVDPPSLPKMICPDCGRPMRIKERKSDGRPFWGCTGYFDRDNQCSKIVNIPEGQDPRVQMSHPSGTTDNSVNPLVSPSDAVITRPEDQQRLYPDKVPVEF